MNTKKLILLLILSGALTACGDKKEDAVATGLTCASFEGDYTEYLSTPTLTIYADCTFNDSVCGYTAGFTLPDPTTNLGTITVAGTNGTPGCLASTDHLCTITLGDVSLGIDCGPSHQFLFIRD